MAKIVFGFAVGLGAGIGATSVFWLWGGAAVAPLSAPSQAGPQGSQSIASPALSVGPGVATPPAPAAIAPLVTAAAALHPAPAPIAPAEDAPEVLAMLPGAGLQGYGRAEDRLPATPVIDMPLVRAAPMAPGLPVRATEPATAGAPLAAPAGVVLIVVLDAKQAQPETGALGAVSTAFAAISGVEPTPESWPPLPDGAPTAVALPPPPAVIEAAPAVASGVEDLPDLSEGGLVAPLPSHRVTVLAPPSLAEAIIGQTDDALRDAGFTTAEPKRVGVTISATHVRYYHADDRAVAERLAARFGGEARDFSRSDNASARGSIELWMEGSAPKPARVAKAKPVKKKSAPQRAQAPREDPQVRALRDKIVRNLQTGTTP